MRCAITSRSGQVLARGKLSIHKEENGTMRLALETNGGTSIQGGIIGDDGDLTAASEELFQECYQTWRMTGLTLTITIR
jgi:hypothetical protein